MISKVMLRTPAHGNFSEFARTTMAVDHNGGAKFARTMMAHYNGFNFLGQRTLSKLCLLNRP
jgi:hypothetical protein